MIYSMPLNQLLSVLSKDIKQLDVANFSVEKLVIDSRQIGNNTLFIAYAGAVADGRDFIESAQAQGAVAVLYDAESFTLPDNITIPAYPVIGLQKKVGLLAHQFYGRPSEEMQIFGVTGTNGKTTCCYLLTQALTKLNMKAAMIGTIGVGQLDSLIDSGHTTPDPISTHKLLAQWRDEGITQVCMEVSSHALDQGRVVGVQFFCTLFTNLSHDHLDYHGDMTRYAAVKQQLFTDFVSELVITNADDDIGAGLIDIANSDFIASYGEAGDVCLEEVTLRDNGLELLIDANGVEFEVNSRLIGKINVPNILLVVTTLLALSTSIEDVQRIVSELESAPGRMELFANQGLPSVVVDYAHTPDALEKALLSVKEHCQGELWCVFGCGGDRDKTKRPLMGQAAVSLAQQVIITNDNPRSEVPERIAGQIMSSISEGHSTVQIVLDRAQAIQLAISQAAVDDWVLLAGKGHETTQHIGDEVRDFSDREQVVLALGVAA